MHRAARRLRKRGDETIARPHDTTANSSLTLALFSRFAIVAVALLIATFAVASQVWLVTELTPDPHSPIYPTPDQKAEVLLNAHDGKFFAALAADPLVNHADRIGPEVGERASRPLWSWLAWAGSFGRRDRIPSVLMVLTALSFAALVAAILLLRDALGRDDSPALALAISGAPGVLALVLFPGLNDAFGLALVLAGFAAWKRNRSGIAIAAFAAAGLCHEALLICPVAVLVDEWAAGRRNHHTLRWLLALVPYGTWVLYVRVRANVWPTGSSTGNLDLPFVGLANALHERWHLLDVVCFVVILLASVVAWTKLRDVAFRLTLVVFAGIAAILGPYIWARWVDFGRVLLPVCALAVVALATPELSPTRRDGSG